MHLTDSLINIVTLAKVISNRPGVAVTGTTPGSTIPDVGVYGSNSNLGNVKINVDSKLYCFKSFVNNCSI